MKVRDEAGSKLKNVKKRELSGRGGPHGLECTGARGGQSGAGVHDEHRSIIYMVPRDVLGWREISANGAISAGLGLARRSLVGSASRSPL